MPKPKAEPTPEAYLRTNQDRIEDIDKRTQRMEKLLEELVRARTLVDKANN